MKQSKEDRLAHKENAQLVLLFWSRDRPVVPADLLAARTGLQRVSTTLGETFDFYAAQAPAQ